MALDAGISTTLNSLFPRQSLEKNSTRPAFGRRIPLPDGSAGEFIFDSYGRRFSAYLFNFFSSCLVWVNTSFTSQPALAKLLYILETYHSYGQIAEKCKDLHSGFFQLGLTQVCCSLSVSSTAIAHFHIHTGIHTHTHTLTIIPTATATVTFIHILSSNVCRSLTSVSTRRIDLSGVYPTWQPKPESTHRLQANSTPLPSRPTSSLVVIPLYDTLGPDASAYVINHSESTTIVSSGENLPKVPPHALLT